MHTLKLSSGFVIELKPLSPYYLDFIEDQFPLPKFPSRKIILASGDTIDFEYTLPKAAPEDVEELELYLRYKQAEFERNDVEVLRNRARRDFLLATCVYVKEGPIDFDDKEWEGRVEAAFPKFTVPTHKGKRMLTFLKAIVITTAEEMDLVLQGCLYQEVDMQSIFDALQGFRDSVVRTELI
jgi:hypothetical protein